MNVAAGCRKTGCAYVLGFIFLQGVVADAQEVGSASGVQPSLSVTILVVPEEVACPPDGYTAHMRDPKTGQLVFVDSGGELTTEKVDELQLMFPQSSVEHQLTSLDTVLLGDEIGALMQRYPQPPENDPSQRLAVIFLFHVRGAESQPITFHRTQVGVKDKERTIPDGDWQGTVGDRGNWMNHQRADAILPRNAVLFTVKVGEQVWRFKTGV